MWLNPVQPMGSTSLPGMSTSGDWTMSERNESPQYRNKGRGPLWLGAGVLLGSVAAAGITYGVLNYNNDQTQLEPAPVVRQAEEMPSYTAPIIEAVEVEVIEPTPEPPPYQSHELRPYLLESYWDITDDYWYELSKNDENHRLSDYKPQYVELVNDLKNGKNIFSENNLFYDHVESWNHVQLTLEQILEIEGFNHRKDGYIQKPNTPNNKYADLYTRLMKDDATDNWVAFKETAAKVLGKEKLEGLEMFEKMLYEASIEANNFSWYEK